MACEKFEQLLPSYVEGELGAAEKNLVEEHLRSCSACALLRRQLEEVSLSLGHFPELDISPDLRARLYAIPGQKKPWARLRLSLDFLGQPSLQPVFAAATALLLFLSFYLFHPNRAAIDRSIDRQLHLGYSRIEKTYVKASSWVDRLSAYKDNISTSLKEWNPLRGEENKMTPEEESSWKKRSS